MKKIFLLILTFILTAVAQGQPAPGGTPAPPSIVPPGEQLPIDENIAIGLAVAVVLGFLFFYSKVRKGKTLNIN